MTLVARGHGTPAELLASVKQAVWQGDPQAAVFEAAMLDEVLDREVLARAGGVSLVAGGFALVALVLSTLGIHGIVSHGVSTRVREFGVRVALGASPTSLPRLAMREALLPVAAGLACGLALALAAGRMMRAVLVGVDRADPRVLSGTIGALALAALVAAWRPAARTSRLDPLTRSATRVATVQSMPHASPSRVPGIGFCTSYISTPPTPPTALTSPTLFLDSPRLS